MAANENEVDNRPYAPPAVSEAVVSGTPTGRICHKLVINVTTALTTFAITTLDGVAAGLGALPVGVYTFDIQFNKVTWTGGAATAAAYARI